MPNIENLVCTCDWCKEEFSLLNSNLSDIQVEIDGEKLFLKILKCPLCQHESCVQIDNVETMELLKKQFLINANAAIDSTRYKTNGKLRKHYTKRLKQISALLIQKRKELNLKYNGSVYYFEGKESKISLNVPDIKISGCKVENEDVEE